MVYFKYIIEKVPLKGKLMDMDQLAQELEMLKNESAMAKQEKRMGGFIDKYGTKFNGNTDIANLILAEMDRRGVSEASEAASEAVQSVLDKLREEATAILDETKGAMAEVSDLVGKIDDIQQAVDAAAGGTNEPIPPPMPEMDPAAMGGVPPEMGGAEAIPPEAGGAPPMPEEAGAPGGGGEMPPPEAAGAPPPIEGDLGAGGGAPPPEAPPAEAGAGGAPPPGEPPLPPEQVPSDVRLKNIKSKFASFAAAKKTPTVPSDQNIKKVWRPSKSMLDGVRGVL
jgi:hypothetical protein